MNKEIYTEIMNDDFLKRLVLVEFGFGSVQPNKVINWVKQNYPNLFQQIMLKVDSKQSNVVEFLPETELMSRAERDSILDKIFGKEIR